MVGDFEGCDSNFEVKCLKISTNETPTL